MRSTPATPGLSSPGIYTYWRDAGPAGRGGVVNPDAPDQPSGRSTSDHPVALFCTRPQGRIDDAVNQGLSILAGLALGSSVGGPGSSEK